MTAIGFKRAENSRGNFVKSIECCDVREKNHSSRIIIDGLIFRSLVRVCIWERRYLARSESLTKNKVKKRFFPVTDFNGIKYKVRHLKVV